MASDQQIPGILATPVPGSNKVVWYNIGEGNGNRFWVDSGSGSDSNSGVTPFDPLATLDAAINKCTANQGDKIYIMPGHAETKSASGSLFAADVAGVEIIGLGDGADRATFTFSHAGAATTISAASVVLKNVVFVAGVDSVTAPLTISAADVTLEDVEFRDTTDIEFVRAVITTAAADRLTVRRFFYNGYTGGNACVNAFRLVGADSAVFDDCNFQGLFSTAVIEFHTTACSKVVVRGCEFNNTGTTNFSKSVVDTVTGSTWMVRDCFDLAAGAFFSGGSGAALAGDDVSSLASSIGTITNTGGTATIGGVLGDFANDSLVSRLADIGSDVDSTVTSDLQGKIGTDTEMADRSVYDLLNGGGPASAAAAAVPGNNASLYAVLRDIWDAVRNGTGGSEPPTNTSLLDTIHGTASAGKNSFLGIQVTRAAADIVNGATTPVFTISGGRVLVTGLFGVTSGAALDAGASTIKFQSNPTTGSTTDLCATLDPDADEIGTMYSVDGVPGTALVRGESGGVQGMSVKGVVVPVGQIEFVSSVDKGTGGGLLALDLFYFPLDAGASVASA